MRNRRTRERASLAFVYEGPESPRIGGLQDPRLRRAELNPFEEEQRRHARIEAEMGQMVVDLTELPDLDTYPDPEAQRLKCAIQRLGVIDDVLTPQQS